MSGVHNTPAIHEPDVEIARSCMEHRAIWMGLIYDEMVKAGVENAEEITRRAIYRCGQYHGGLMKAACGGSEDCRDFSRAFNSELDQKEFEMDVVHTPNDIHITFHYCPLVAGWQKLGFDDERIALLCDMAMEGDRGIMAVNGLSLELGDTIGRGCDVCKMDICKDGSAKKI